MEPVDSASIRRYFLNLGGALLLAYTGAHLRAYFHFIERQNLTIRRGNCYLQRKTASHARETGHLDGSLALQMCHYNFIRPHMALKFGKETRTPAIQAGIVSKKLSFRDIFTWQELLFLCLLLWLLIQQEKLTRKGESDMLTTLE